MQHAARATLWAGALGLIYGRFTAKLIAVGAGSALPIRIKYRV